MKWWIKDTRTLIAEPTNYDSLRGTLSIEQFEHLTGRKLNWVVRIGRYIISQRSKGHIELFDEKFITNEVYRHDRHLYKCIHVSTNGEALLTPITGKMWLSAMTCSNAEEWSIQ